MDALCDHALFNFSVQDADLMDYIEAIQGLLVASPDTDEDQALVLNAINVVEEYILATPHTKATYSYLLPSVSLLKQELSYYVSVPSTLDGPVITDDEQGSMSSPSSIDRDIDTSMVIEEVPDKTPVIRCNVCWGEESFVNDCIVICDECDVAVHESCYSIPHVPESSWFCNFCDVQRVAPAETWEPVGECRACHLKGGALMPSHVPNTWVHMSCAIYLPELYFLHHNVVGLDALKPRRKLKCMFCKQPNKGACAQCAHPKCTASYHVQCALEHGVTFHDTSGTGTSYTSLCPTHHLRRPLPLNQVCPTQPETTKTTTTDTKVQRNIQQWLSEPVTEVPAAPTTTSSSTSTTPSSKPPKTKLKKGSATKPSGHHPETPKPRTPDPPKPRNPLSISNPPSSSFSTFRPSKHLAQVFVPANPTASDDNLFLVVLPQLPLGMDFAYSDESGKNPPWTIQDISNPLLRGAVDSGLIQKGDQVVAINNVSLEEGGGVTPAQLSSTILPRNPDQHSVQVWLRRARTCNTDDVDWPWGFLRSDGKLAMVPVWQEMADVYFSPVSAKPSIKYFRAYFQNKADSRHVPALGYAVPPVVRRHRRVSMQAKNMTNILPPLDEGDMVQVAARTWPGINKLGGTGRIKAKHVVDGQMMYDIAYILGGAEKGVERQYITPVSEDNPVNMNASVNQQEEDKIERWTVYAEYTDYFQHHPSVQRTLNDGFHLTFQQVIRDQEEETLQEITNKNDTTVRAAMYGQVVVTAVVGQDEMMMEEEDEILRELEICQGRLDQLEAGIHAQLTPVMEKLSKERRDLYDTKLERLVASQVEVTYNQLINLQHQHDNMNDSSDDEEHDDEPRNPETPKPLGDPGAPPPVQEEEEEERLNPLFASISESTGHVCVLCGVSGGDLAATSCGHKAHIMCLLYTPETYFEHAMGFGVANIPPRRRTLVCALCKTSTGVNKIQCHAKKCTKPMHVQCAFVSGLLTTHPTFCGWCPKHLKLADAATQASVDLPPHLQTTKRKFIQDDKQQRVSKPQDKTQPPVEQVPEIVEEKATKTPEIPAKEPRHENQVFQVGDTVDVLPRLWAGINKPGGVGRVKARHDTPDTGMITYDIEYVLGCRDKNVPRMYLTKYTPPTPNQHKTLAKRRRTTNTL